MITPTLGAYYHGMGDRMHIEKEQILYFHKQGLAILQVDDRREEIKAVYQIDQQEILSEKIERQRLHLLCTVETKQGTLIYKIRKSVLGSPWHKENVRQLLQAKKG